MEFSNCLLVIGVFILLCNFVLSFSRFLSCLIVLESLNVLLLFVCIISEVDEFRVLFLALMVVFTIEVVLGLVILTRLWDSSGLIGLVGE